MSESDYTLLTGSIYEKDGTLYQQIDGEFTPLRFNTHDGGGQGADGNIINHQNVQVCGWEVEENSHRNFCSTAILPSENFNEDIKWKDGVTKEEIKAIQEWATADLEIADKLCEENLKPLEAEGITNDFSEWLNDDEPDLITPILLKRDLGKTPTPHLINRAIRNGVYGFDVGEPLPTKEEIEQMKKSGTFHEGEKSPHFRTSYFGLRWTGEGRAIPKVVRIKECIVGLEKMKKVPTGYYEKEDLE